MSNLAKSWLLNTSSFGRIVDTMLPFGATSVLSFSNRFPKEQEFIPGILAGSSRTTGMVLRGSEYHWELGSRMVVPDEKPVAEARWSDIHRFYGPAHLYTDFCRSTGHGIAQAVILNLLGDDTIERTGFKHPSETETDVQPFIGHLTNIRGKILVLAPDDRVTKDQGKARRDWAKHLERGADRVAEVSIANAFIPNNKYAAIYRVMMEKVYGNYCDWKLRQSAKTDRYLQKFSYTATLLPLLQKRLRKLRVDALHELHPAKFKTLRDETFFALAIREVRGQQDGILVFRRTGTFAFGKGTHLHASADEAMKEGEDSSLLGKANALVAQWNLSGLPDRIKRSYDEMMVESITPKFERFKLPTKVWPQFVLSEDEAIQLEKRLADIEKAVQAAFALPQEPVSSTGKCVRMLAVDQVIKTLADEYGELYATARDADRDAPGRSANKYHEALTRFQRRAASKLSFAALHIELWNVRENYISDPIKGTVERLFPLREAETETTSAPAPLLEVPVFKQEYISASSLDEAREDLRKALSSLGNAFALGATCLESRDVPDLGSMPAYSMASLNAPVIEITGKLRPRFFGSSESFLMADGRQQFFNAALGRKSGIMRAFLEKPTLIAQGGQFAADQLRQLGYSVTIEESTINRLSRLKEKSDLNQCPLRPILPFEATAYYNYGKMTAQATLFNTEGKPIWIEGKDYTITPGWDRRSQVVSDEDAGDIPDALNEVSNNNAREVTSIDFAVQYWDVETETATIRIYEHETREEAELRTSSQLFPEVAASILAPRPATPAATPRATARGSTTPTVENLNNTVSDEDYAMLMGIQASLNNAVALENTTGASRATSQAQTPTAPPVPKWPGWTVYLDEFIEVFPPPTPEPALVFHRERLQTIMEGIRNRFGLKYRHLARNGSEFVPEAVKQRGFEIWLADRQSTSPAQPVAMELAATP